MIDKMLPMIPKAAMIKVEDNFHDFIRTGPGLVHARSKNKFLVKGTDEVVPFTVEQSIRWNECTTGTEQTGETMRLDSTRNFIIYDKDEENVRYTMTSNISQHDPCGGNGLCLALGDTPSWPSRHHKVCEQPRNVEH